MRWSAADTETSIPDRLHRLALREPDRVALVGQHGAVTYAELDAISDSCAEAIRARLDGHPRGRTIALLLEQDASLFAAALGALKCSASVLTLNPSDPPARHRQLWEASGAALAIAGGVLGEAGGFGSDRVLDIQTALGGSAPAQRPQAPPGPNDLAFLIATSGSTGTPKLVGHTHRNMLHNVLRYTNGLGIGPDDRIALLASFAGGQGLVTTWTALLNHAVLCPFPIARRGVTGLAQWLEAQAITVLDALPSILRSFALTYHGPPIEGIRLVRLASEPATAADFADFARMFGAGSALASVFACSEAGIMAHTTLHAGDAVDGERLPVGQPAEGLELLLLDELGHPVAEGEVGEVVVASPFLSPGYWGDDPLTAARFHGQAPERRFHTGDLARRRPDGTLTIVGRRDNQVKVRGYRLQLEEVENVIARHPSVQAAAVTATRTPRGDTRLVAFVLPSAGSELTAGSLRSAVETELPAHAVPAQFTVVESLPLGANGKVDRVALASITVQAQSNAPSPPPDSESEELVASLWARAFECDRVDPTDRFLDLGGDSLIAAVIAADLSDLYGVALDLSVFSENPSVSELAARVHGTEAPAHQATDSETGSTPALQRIGPISFAQQRIWFQEQRRRGVNHVLVPVRITGRLDVERLRLSFERLVQRHEILRTNYMPYGNLALAVVHAPEPVTLPVFDLTDDEDQQAAIQDAIAQEQATHFHLASGPLVRLTLLRLGEESHLLLRSSHHIIHDGLTWRILFEELAETYEALEGGTADGEAEPPQLQYLDYAVAERRRPFRKLSAFERELEWWAEQMSPPPVPLPVPVARPEPLSSGPAEGRTAWGLPAETCHELDRIAVAAGATFFMSRLALISGFLMLEAGHNEVLLRTPLNTRLSRELGRLVGPLLNDAPLRLRLDPELSYSDWLRAVRGTIIGVSAHLSSPWQLIDQELRLRGVDVPPPDALYLLWNDIPPIRFGALELETLQRVPHEAPILRFRADRRHEGTRSWIEYAPRLHDPDRVARFAARLRSFAAAVVAAPEKPLDQISPARSGASAGTGRPAVPS